jgi:hypothetical protein
MNDAQDIIQERIAVADLETYRAEDAVRLYAGSVRIISSFFEFILVLGQLDVGVKGPGRIREVGSLYLSPQHAKAVSVLLNEKIAEYEGTYGRITTPTEVGRLIRDRLSGANEPEQRGEQSPVSAQVSDEPPAQRRPSSRRAAQGPQQQNS